MLRAAMVLAVVGGDLMQTAQETERTTSDLGLSLKRRGATDTYSAYIRTQQSKLDKVRTKIDAIDVGRPVVAPDASPRKHRNILTGLALVFLVLKLAHLACASIWDRRMRALSGDVEGSVATGAAPPAGAGVAMPISLVTSCPKLEVTVPTKARVAASSSSCTICDWPSSAPSACCAVCSTTLCGVCPSGTCTKWCAGMTNVRSGCSSRGSSRSVLSTADR